MSALSASTVSPSAVPPIDPANEPAVIRNGTPAEKQAYQTALGFEQMLMNELTQQLSNSVSGSSYGSSGADDGSGDGSGSTDASTGLMGSDPASSAYAQLLPDAMSSSVMSSGGTGIALQLAEAIDPSIGNLPTHPTKR